MTAQPLARFLVDFERERTRAWAVASGPARAVEPAPEILARHRDELAAARAAGREEGRADERGETERVLASVKRESEAQRAEARAAWVRDQGEVFATMLTESLDAIERRVTEQVAAVLSDLVLEAARARMVDELAAILRDLLASDRHLLRIEAPDDLIDALRHHLASQMASIDFTATAGPDVRVAVGDAWLETRLGAWRDYVCAVLA
jgi:hypothetical protein